jgi:hypothetical protein
VPTIPSMVQELLVLLVVSPSLQSSRLLLVSVFFFNLYVALETITCQPLLLLPTGTFKQRIQQLCAGFTTRIEYFR